jgi:hypothetical protein
MAWAEEAYVEGRGWDMIISILAGHNPERDRRLRRRCTHLEIARSYRFRMAAHRSYPLEDL